MDTKQLRQKILDLAIRGKLVPQDPNDEPASVLLERIKAEKERLIAEGKIKRSKKLAASSDKPHYAEWDLPSGWVRCNLIDICTVFSTGPFGSMVHKSDYIESRGIPIVNPMNIIDGCIVKEKLAMVSPQKAHELARYTLQKNDILLARRGDLSKCAIVNEQSSGWLCGTGSFFLHIPFVEPQYIMLFYLSEYVQTILKRECVGATMENLNQGVLGSIPLLLPPIKEQKRIIQKVKTLKTIVFNIDSGSQEIRRLTSQVKSKILELAISGKLVQQDPADEPAADLLKRVNPNAVVSADTSHYQHLPQGWCVCKLEDIVDYEQPQRYIVESTEYSDAYKTPVLTAGKSFVIGHTDETTGVFNNVPVIIFDDFTTDSKYVDFPFKVKSSAMKILHVKSGVNIKYVYYFMSITRLVGKTHKRYWISEYSKLDIPLPPYSEQCRIVDAIERINNRIDDIAEAL